MLIKQSDKCDKHNIGNISYQIEITIIKLITILKLFHFYRIKIRKSLKWPESLIQSSPGVYMYVQKHMYEEKAPHNFHLEDHRCLSE